MINENKNAEKGYITKRLLNLFEEYHRQRIIRRDERLVFANKVITVCVIISLISMFYLKDTYEPVTALETLAFATIVICIITILILVIYELFIITDKYN